MSTAFMAVISFRQHDGFNLTDCPFIHLHLPFPLQPLHLLHYPYLVPPLYTAPCCTCTLRHRTASSLSATLTARNTATSASASTPGTDTESAVRTSDLGLQILKDSLTAAMTVIAPSCLRGLAVQLPNVSTVIMIYE